MMDWRYGPGESPLSVPGDRPTPELVAAFASLLDSAPLRYRDFGRDYGNLVWRLLDEEVSAGRLPKAGVDALRRDTDAVYSAPLALKYLAQGKGAEVTKWMRGLASFWDYNWIDRSVQGGRGRGTLRLFDLLRDNGAAPLGAALACEHIRFRFTGARYHAGLRQQLNHWYKFHGPQAQYPVPVTPDEKNAQLRLVERSFGWIEYILTSLRSYVVEGDLETIAKLERIESDVAKEWAKFCDARS